jgi:hypothetical protein
VENRHALIAPRPRSGKGRNPELFEEARTADRDHLIPHASSSPAPGKTFELAGGWQVDSASTCLTNDRDRERMLGIGFDCRSEAEDVALLSAFS